MQTKSSQNTVNIHSWQISYVFQLNMVIFTRATRRKENLIFMDPCIVV